MGLDTFLLMIADIEVWIPQAKALFDVQVTDANAASYVC